MTSSILDCSHNLSISDSKIGRFAKNKMVSIIATKSKKLYKNKIHIFKQGT